MDFYHLDCKAGAEDLWEGVACWEEQEATGSLERSLRSLLPHKSLVGRRRSYLLEPGGGPSEAEQAVPRC